MLGRPRLVEEGTPIYGPGSEAFVDHDMTEEGTDGMDEDRTGKEISSQTSHPSSSTKNKSSGLSSLQQAALGLGRKKHNSVTRSKTVLQTAYVVGGESTPLPNSMTTTYSDYAQNHSSGDFHHYGAHPPSTTINYSQGSLSVCGFPMGLE